MLLHAYIERQSLPKEVTSSWVSDAAVPKQKRFKAQRTREKAALRIENKLVGLKCKADLGKVAKPESLFR